MSELDALRSLIRDDQDLPFSLGGQLPLNRCPHCGVAKPNIGRKWGPSATTAHHGANKRFWAAYECATCGGVLLAGSKHGKDGTVSEMYPAARGPHPALPDDAQRYLREAIETLNSPSASIMVAASAVDAMLKEKDYTEGSLYNRIDKAAKDNVITDEMAAWAHDVRLDANDQRHADEDADAPETEDARRCVEFAKAFGEFLFVLPARVERGREAAQRTEE